MTHTQAIESVFKNADDPLDFQAAQLAKKLDDARDELAAASKRAAGWASDAVRADSPEQALIQCAGQITRLGGLIAGLEIGLEALCYQRPGAFKKYVEALRRNN